MAGGAPPLKLPNAGGPKPSGLKPGAKPWSSPAPAPQSPGSMGRYAPSPAPPREKPPLGPSPLRPSPFGPGTKAPEETAPEVPQPVRTTVEVETDKVESDGKRSRFYDRLFGVPQETSEADAADGSDATEGSEPGVPKPPEPEDDRGDNGPNFYHTAFSGDEMVEVPPVAGKPEGTAQGMIKEAGLTSYSYYVEYGDLPNGTVMSSKPLPGTEVPVGSRVDLMVAGEGRRQDNDRDNEEEPEGNGEKEQRPKEEAEKGDLENPEGPGAEEGAEMPKGLADGGPAAEAAEGATAAAEGAAAAAEASAAAAEGAAVATEGIAATAPFWGPPLAFIVLFFALFLFIVVIITYSCNSDGFVGFAARTLSKVSGIANKVGLTFLPPDVCSEVKLDGASTTAPAQTTTP